MPSEPAPFASDLDFWTARTQLSIAMLSRVAADHPVQRPSAYRCPSCCTREEADLRATIRARIEATRSSGRALAIDAAREHLDGLTQVECEALALGVASVIARARVETLCYEQALVRTVVPNVELLLHAVGLGIESRLKALPLFAPTGRLARSGLLDLGSSADWSAPTAVLGASVVVTEVGLDVLLGTRPVSGLDR